MLAVDEKHGCMTSVLMQEHGSRQKPVAYFSAKLEPVAAGLVVFMLLQLQRKLSWPPGIL